MGSELQIDSIQKLKFLRETDGKHKSGLRVYYKSVRATKYTLLNHSSHRSVPKLYIDHTAGTAHGGYTITTTERSVKTTTGFSRFEYSLAPQRELEFIVTEEVVHTSDLMSDEALQGLLEKEGLALREQGILLEEMVTEIQEMIQRRALKKALTRVINGVADENDLSAWSKIEGNFMVPPAVLEPLAKKATINNEIQAHKRLLKAQTDTIDKITKTQARLRENIKGLEKVEAGDLLKRYLKDLNEQEDELLKANSSIKQLDEQIFAAQASLTTVNGQCIASAKAALHAVNE